MIVKTGRDAKGRSTSAFMDNEVLHISQKNILTQFTRRDHIYLTRKQAKRLAENILQALETTK